MNCVIETIIERGFPPGSRMVLDSKACLPDKRFWAILDKTGHPRWIFNANCPPVLKLLQTWQPYDLDSQLKWAAVLLSYQAGLCARLPGAIEFGIDIPPDAVWDFVGWQRDVAPALAIYVGRESSICKAVMFLVEVETAGIAGVVKIPVGDAAGENIIREGEALGRLMREVPGVSPDLLFLDKDRPVMVQSYRRGAKTGRIMQRGHIQLLERLRIPERETCLAWQVNELKQRLHNRGLKIEPWLERQMDALQEEEGLPAVWAHGDFAPWNIKRAKDGGYYGIDWEQATENALPLYDVFHFYFIQNLIAGRNVNILREIRENRLTEVYTAELGLSELQIKKLFRFFLLDYWCRRLEENDALAAESVQRAIQPVLETGL